MRTYDFSPLYRTAIGFDRLASLLDDATRGEAGSGYPPYNIELVDENHYRISMAVAGFAESELDLELERDTLTISGKKARQDGEAERRYLHRGIAAREFTQRFELADHMQVTGARLDNGLLHVDLVREIPEAMKPRKIEVTRGDNARLIEGEAA